MVAPHDLCQNPLFSHKMICKQYIILNHVFFWYKSNLKPVTYSPFWLNIVLNVPKLKITQTHIPHNNTSQIIFFVLFTFSVRVNNPWPKQFVLFVCFFFNVRNCHLVSLIVLVLQWILRWSKRVSLRSVSSTNYPTLHHPQLSIFFFFYMFRNFMHHQILQYTKSNTHNIYTCLNLQNSKMVKNTLGQ